MNESEVEEHRIESGEEFLLITAKVRKCKCSNVCLIQDLQFAIVVDLLNFQLQLAKVADERK